MTFSFSKTVDTLIALRIVKLLVQRWEDTDAFKLGIIDKEGNFLKKTRELKTAEEKKAFTKFHVIMFRLKKLLEKLPFGKTKLASLAVAIMLLKEETNTRNKKLVESVIWMYMKDSGYSETINNLCEQIDVESEVTIGSHTVKEDLFLENGDTIPAGSVVRVESNTPVATVFGVKVFEAVTKTGEQVFVTKDII